MRWVLAVLVTIAGAAAAAGCGNSETDSRADGKTVTTKARAPARPDAAVVYVKARYQNHTTEGTGFVYDARQGLILTSDHAVEAAPAITVVDHGGAVLHGQVLARAQCHDLAVVRLHPVPADLQKVTFAPSGSVGQGDHVTVLAYTLQSSSKHAPQLVSTTGTVAATGIEAKLHPMLPAMARLIAHQVPLNEHGSGSPLLNAQGKAVGINTLVGEKHGAGAVEGLNYALGSDYIAQRLGQLHPDEGRSYTGWRDEHRCHRAMAMIAGVPAKHTDGGMEEMDAGSTCRAAGTGTGADQSGARSRASAQVTTARQPTPETR
jgi:S1-C subfamily serine protease